MAKIVPCIKTSAVVFSTLILNCYHSVYHMAALNSANQPYKYVFAICMEKFCCQLNLIRACHQNGKTSSCHPRLIVEEMSQLAHKHILDIEQTLLALESEGEKL